MPQKDGFLCKLFEWLSNPTHVIKNILIVAGWCNWHDSLSLGIVADTGLINDLDRLQLLTELGLHCAPIHILLVHWNGHWQLWKMELANDIFSHDTHLYKLIQAYHGLEIVISFHWKSALTDFNINISFNLKWVHPNPSKMMWKIKHKTKLGP